MSAEYAVHTEELTRKFGNVIAVNHLNLKIKQGELFGFLGPNGAGKSTTLRMLIGILEPTSGNGTVLGIDVVRKPEEVKSAIGYMSQKFSLYDDLTAEENLRFYARIYMVPELKQNQRIVDIIESINLKGFERKLAGHLSGGYRQRLALACALVHEPRLLFLDEPTAGVDPVSRRNFWKIIRGLVSSGITVVVTTHYMDEAELCDTLGFMYQGELIAYGSPDKIKQEVFHKPVFELEVQEMPRVLELFGDWDAVEEVTRIGAKLRLVLAREEFTVDNLKSFLLKHDIAVNWIRKVEPSIEDIFVSFVEGGAAPHLLLNHEV